MDKFAAELAAEKIFTLGGVGITNSFIYGLISAGMLILVLTQAAKYIRKHPSGVFASLVEVAIEYVVNTAANIMHDRGKAVRFAPLILSVFLFILLSNWLGLLPGVGTITSHGHPIFRPFTSDLNGTLALAAFTVVLVQIYAVRELGFGKYLQHYFSDKPWNPINFFVGILEILGEFTKVASLSLRLFGNVFAGEVLLLTIASISSYLSPLTTLPFYFLEIFVGLIQAFVFTMLTIVYLSVATHHEHKDEEAAMPKTGPTNDDHSLDTAKPLAEVAHE